MGESNGGWGILAERDPELADQWDGFKPLPEPGVNEALDNFCASKRITIDALVRVGARMSAEFTLAFAFPGGIKYRELITERRWSTTGAEWYALKILPAREPDATTVIIAEGETDAARCTLLFPQFDVAIMPAGAKTWTAAYADQLTGYERVLVGLDSDQAGNEGAAKILASLTNAVRYAPPDKDWCDTDTPPELPTVAPTLPMLVAGRELLSLEVPEVASWLDEALLPIGGFMLLHGAAKGFKSWMAFDIASSIATAEPWCGFESTEEPARVAVVQFEIPWAYYRERCGIMRAACPDAELWDANYFSFSPLARPLFVAGNKKHEDNLLRELVGAGIQVLVFDPVRRAMGTADMNSEQDVRRILGFFDRCNREGITVVATHHDNKSASRAGGGDMNDMTGAGSFSGDADTIINVAIPKGMGIRDPYRNLYFDVRNGPTPSARGFRLDNEALSYRLEPWSADEDGTDVPAI